jgi:diaminopimelate epimerase
MLFTKIQTNGNDFVIIHKSSVNSKSLIQCIGDRQFGVGCDQIVCIRETDTTSYHLDIFNSDGSIAAMCGNGICAAALYVKSILMNEHKDLIFSVSGIDYKTLIVDDGIKLFVNTPKLLHSDQNYEIISTGNKHLVCNINMIDSAAKLRDDFPDCNLHFISCSNNVVTMKTFERGAGWTKACGSGAIAVAFSQKLARPITIKHDGGISIVEHNGDNYSILVTPKLVYEGRFYEH